MMMARLFVGGLMVLVLGAAPAAMAASGAGEDWQHTVKLYVMGASIDGTVGLGQLESDVSMSRSDIFDNLEMGAMAGYRAERGDWAVMGELIYMDLGADFESQRGLLRGEAGFSQWVVELDGLRRLTPSLELLFGARWMSVSSDLRVEGPAQPRRVESDESWVDPVLGLRLDHPLGDRLRVELIGSVGGFGVGSDLAWMAVADLDYRLGRVASLVLGYTHLDVDYEDGEGSEHFVFDMEQGGPWLGLRLRF